MADGLNIDYSLNTADSVTGGYDGTFPPGSSISLTSPKPTGSFDTTERQELKKELGVAQQDVSKTADEIIKANEELGKSEIGNAALEQWFVNNYPQGDIKPPQFNPITLDDLRANIIPLMIGATLAGMGSRRHYMGAMKALGGMMKGADEGRKEQFEASRSQYEASVANLKQQQEAYKKEFDSILSSRKLDMTAKNNAIRSLEMKYGKQIQHEDNIQRSIDRTYAEEQNFNNMQQKSRDLTIRLAATNAQNHVGLTPDAIKAEAAGALMSGGRIQNFGRYGKGDMEAIGNEMASLMGRLNLPMEALPAMGAKFKANLSSLQIQYKRHDTLTGVFRSFENNAQTWQEVAAGMTPSILAQSEVALRNALDKSSTPTGDINKWGSAWVNEVILLAKQQFNDPQAASYMAATMAVAMDYGRIIGGGGFGSVAMTAEGARKDAKEIARAGYTKETRDKLIQTWTADAAGQVDGVRQQTDAIEKRLQNLVTEKETPTAPAAPADPLGIRK